MTELQRYTGGSAVVPSSWSRTGRELGRLANQVEIGSAHTNAVAELEEIKLSALRHVAGHAMQDVAMVSQLEGQLSTAVPLATSRLQALGDMHALACADILASMPRRMS
jgi:hypothetical protein